MASCRCDSEVTLDTVYSLHNRSNVDPEKEANQHHSLQVPDRQDNFQQTSSCADEIRRTKSDIDIVSRMAPDGGVDGGEFYTAVGPDGKEIILRRYLNDQGWGFTFRLMHQVPETLLGAR